MIRKILIWILCGVGVLIPSFLVWVLTLYFGWWVMPSILVSGILIYFTTSTIRSNKLDDHIRREIGDKLWNIPVDVSCSDYNCGHVDTIAFSLETQYVQCSKCKKTSKLTLNFLTIPMENVAEE